MRDLLCFDPITAELHYLRAFNYHDSSTIYAHNSYAFYVNNVLTCKAAFRLRKRYVKERVLFKSRRQLLWCHP